MNANTLFASAGLTPGQLVIQLDAISSEDFIEQFRSAFTLPDAIQAVKVVYVWTTRNPIVRLRGASNVIYIGKTDQSLSQRHARHAKLEGSFLNWERYHHIIRNFGPITIQYASCSNPQVLEKTFLDLYFKEHLEIPPLNRKS